MQKDLVFVNSTLHEQHWHFWYSRFSTIVYLAPGYSSDFKETAHISNYIIFFSQLLIISSPQNLTLALINSSSFCGMHLSSVALSMARRPLLWHKLQLLEEKKSQIHMTLLKITNRKIISKKLRRVWCRTIWDLFHMAYKSNWNVSLFDWCDRSPLLPLVTDSRLIMWCVLNIFAHA